MRSPGGWLFVAAALAACSSSSSGGGTGSGSGGASSASAYSGVGGSGGLGGAATELSPHGAVLLTWKYLQGEFDSLGQEPIEGGPVPPSSRRLVGCAVDAPELGERVIYLERSPMETDAAPDRQFLIVLDQQESSGPGGSFSSAMIKRLVSPQDWAGGCVVGSTMALLGEVALDDACGEVHLTRNEISTISASVTPMPARCVSSSLDVEEVHMGMIAFGDRIGWWDMLAGADGRRSYDPPGEGSSYELIRGSP
jgi:hypothetical protein